MPAKIVAVVALQADKVGGGAPIFVADTKEQLQQIAFSLEKILDAAAHELNDGTMILVHH